MNSKMTCEACGATSVPQRNSMLWWIPMVFAWVFLVGIAAALSSVIPPLIFVLVPLVFFAATGLMGFLGEKCSREAHCRACGKSIHHVRRALV